MAGIWVGRDPTYDGADTDTGLMVRVSCGPARAPGAGQGRITRRDRRRTQRLWWLALAGHRARWRARHRPHATPGWWPR